MPTESGYRLARSSSLFFKPSAIIRFFTPQCFSKIVVIALIRLDPQRVLPARLRRARDPLHAALASFQTRGGGYDGIKAGSILIREGVATKSGQPELQLDQGRAQKELQGRRKNAEKGGVFREEIINIPNRVSKQGGRAGRCPGPAEEVVAHLEVSRFAVLGSSLLPGGYINTD